MLPPDYLINRIEPITLMYSDLHTAILEAIAEHIADTLRATGEPGVIPSAAYQVERLQHAGMLYEDIIKEVARINKSGTKEIRRLFEDAAVEAIAYDNRVYEAAGLKPIQIAQSPEMLQILEAGISKALFSKNNDPAHDMSIERLTRTIAINSEERFNGLLNVGYNKVVSGAFSYNEAIADAVDDLARSGVSVFHYESGRNISIEAAVRMNILTASNQTAAQITKQSMLEAGISLVRTTAHFGARNKGEGFKNHESWQGKVFYWKELDKGGLQRPNESDKIESQGDRMDDTGASGAIPRNDQRRMDAHAARYYEEIRKRDSDIASIAQNTGFSVEDISRIKQHVFISNHDLGKRNPSRFTPDYDMAVSWQHLIDGKNIREMDIVLLNHELTELTLMSQGLDYDTAHNMANSQYNYTNYVRELDRKEGLF